MRKVLSNGPSKDFVINGLNRLILRSRALFLAAPYFDHAAPVIEAAAQGKRVQLLIGLNSATHPDAVSAVLGRTGVAVRYLTHRFHAKIYVFDEGALLGSANLTNAGLHANREAVICLDQESDADALEETRALFAELWESAAVLTEELAKTFSTAWRQARATGPDADARIEQAVGRAEPVNINVASSKVSRERLFIEGLRRRVYEQYRPAFLEVSTILENGGLRRADLAEFGLAHETNRFLNWVRLAHAPGEETWRSAPLRTPEERRTEIERLGKEWRWTDQSLVPADYLQRLATVKNHLANAAALEICSENDITEALIALHAFSEQLRFVKGGLPALGPAFWRENAHDLARVKRSLSHLLWGDGDLVQRLHDLLYDARWKLNYFGLFCALELCGSVHPDLYPPMNGRMAKGLRFLGFDVRGS